MALFSTTTPLPPSPKRREQKEGSRTRDCPPGTPDIGALGPQLRIILDRRTITTPESTDKKNLHHRAESRVNFHWQITPRDQTNRAASGYTTAAHRPVSSIQICPVALGERSICQGVSAHLDKALRFHSAWVKDHLHLDPQSL